MNKQEIIKNIQLIQVEYLNRKDEIIENDIICSGNVNLFFYFKGKKLKNTQIQIIEKKFVISFVVSNDEIVKYLQFVQDEVKNM